MKFKYTRKEAIELARNKGYGFKSLEKLLLAKQEDKQECHCGKNGHALNSINCPIHGISPSLLNDIETIEEPKAPQGNPNEKYYMQYIGDCIKYASKLIVKSLLIKNK